MDIVSSNIATSNCGFTTTTCETDACAIDLQHLILINQFIENNPSFASTVVTGEGTCQEAPLDKRERKCMGSAPDVYPKKMSDLEQLLTRINWNDDDENDTAVFNAGGLKLNDDKEAIELNVLNQLVTFNWPNVKSFTVKTVDEFHSYYVGWVERANVNNFSNGNTLGDNTKGGAQTVGIFSGDAMIRAHDGFEITQDDDSVQFF